MLGARVLLIPIACARYENSGSTCARYVPYPSEIIERRNSLGSTRNEMQMVADARNHSVLLRQFPVSHMDGEKERETLATLGRESNPCWSADEFSFKFGRSTSVRGVCT